jgi:hypothetical protein
MAPKYPDVVVKLVGEDGNAFSILARVNRAMRDAGVPEVHRDEFRAEATSGDYEHLIATCWRWVTVE